MELNKLVVDYKKDLNIMGRRDKINYYLDIADVILTRGTCLRRKYGAVIVNNDQIISTGYVGAPRGRANCSDLGYCSRDKYNIPRGERYELSRSVHAEANAIINVSRNDMIDGTLYLVGRDAKTNELIPDANCCCMCKRLIINSGLARVIIRNNLDEFTIINVQDWVDNDESLNLELGY